MNNQEMFLELIEQRKDLEAFKFAIDCAAGKSSRSGRNAWLDEIEHIRQVHPSLFELTPEYESAMTSARRGNFQPIYLFYSQLQGYQTGSVQQANSDRERFDQIVAKTTMGLFHIEHVDKVSIKKDRLSLADEWLEWIIYFGEYRIGRQVHVQQMLDFNGDFSETLVEEFRKEVIRLMPMQPRRYPSVPREELKNGS